MNDGWYILLYVTLIGYNGEREEIDLEAGYPIWQRTVHSYPNDNNPTSRNSCKDRWLKIFNDAEKRAELNFPGRIKTTHWVDAKFKYKTA